MRRRSLVPLPLQNLITRTSTAWSWNIYTAGCQKCHIASFRWRHFTGISCYTRYYTVNTKAVYWEQHPSYALTYRTAYFMRAVNIELIISVGVTCKLNSRHSIPGKGEDSLLRHHTQSGSWPQWGSYSLLTAGSLCGCVQLASHLGVTNAWNCNSTPPHVPAPGSGVYEHRGNNILTTVTTGFPACQPSFFS